MIKQESDLETRLAAIEKQLAALIGGKRNDESISNVPTATTSPTGWD